MKYVIYIFLVLLFSGCELSAGQSSNNQLTDEAKKEIEYRELIRKSKEMQSASIQAIQIAQTKSDSVMIKTREKIITLTKIVYVLRETNHNLKSKVDSEEDNDPGQPFDLLAVPSDRH